jgi:hypothetical protein
MFGKLIFAAAIAVGGVALSVPVFAADHGDGRFDEGGHFRKGGFTGGHFGGGSGGNGLRDGRGVPIGIGFAGPRGTGFAHDRDGYDGDHYRHGDDCFPTEPGGCD